MAVREVGREYRHAYLIMAHNEFDFLTELLIDLDDVRNDIYLHIDRKVRKYPKDQLERAVARGKLYFVDPIKVNWGGYSQIACELLLMENAGSHGPYAYYHMLTGANFPLKSQEVIHRFFDEHQGDEFIGFDNEYDYSNRIMYIHLFNEMGKINTRWKEAFQRVRSQFIKLQQCTRYNPKHARGLAIKKGLAYWSLTENAVQYLLGKKALIRKMFRKSLCGDELFAQTLLYSSPFREKLMLDKDELEACLREFKPPLSWGETAVLFQRTVRENVYTFSDMDRILKSGRFFGMKFGGVEAVQLVRDFKQWRDSDAEVRG